MTDTIAEVRPDQPDPLESAAAARQTQRHWLPGLAVVFSAEIALLWISGGRALQRARAQRRRRELLPAVVPVVGRQLPQLHRRPIPLRPGVRPARPRHRRLRLFRLLTIVVVHLVFGWSFMRWLRLHRPTAPPTRLWEAAGIAAVVAAGGVACGWLPLSPGYNDVILLGALLAMSLVLSMAARVAGAAGSRCACRSVRRDRAAAAGDEVEFACNRPADRGGRRRGAGPSAEAGGRPRSRRRGGRDGGGGRRPVAAGADDHRDDGNGRGQPAHVRQHLAVHPARPVCEELFRRSTARWTDTSCCSSRPPWPWR